MQRRISIQQARLASVRPPSASAEEFHRLLKNFLSHAFELPVGQLWQRHTGGCPFYPAPGHCDCCVAGRWHCDMGVMRPPMHSPAHCSPALRPSAQHPLDKGRQAGRPAFGVLAPRRSPCPGGPGGCPWPWWPCPGHSCWAFLAIHLCLQAVSIKKGLCTTGICLVVVMLELRERALVPSA